MEKFRDALEDMVFQFGYRDVKNNKPVIHTAGLNALEYAFDALGWKDPHYLPEEGYTCEVIGCVEADAAGTYWGDLYLRLCGTHTQEAFEKKTRPPIKQWALDREAKRDPLTRILAPYKGGGEKSNIDLTKQPD